MSRAFENKTLCKVRTVVIPPLITEVKSRGLGNRQFHHWGHAV